MNSKNREFFKISQNILQYKYKRVKIKAMEAITMVFYRELAKLVLFSDDDVFHLMGNKSTAHSLLRRLTLQNLVKKVRNGLYVCINPATDERYASKFQIASKINDGAYVSHQSAMEYYGLSNQVMSTVYVSSDHRFRDFLFDEETYRWVPSNANFGIDDAKNDPFVRITDIERTLLDTIKDMNKIGGVDMVIQTMSAIKSLDQKRLLSYLSMYDNQFLYQKTGFLLSHFQQELSLTSDFFMICKSMMGKSTRYFSTDASRRAEFVKEWQLIVATELWNTLPSGKDDVNATI